MQLHPASKWKSSGVRLDSEKWGEGENRRESRGFLTDSFKCEKPRDVEECEDESLRKFSQESGENVSLLHL